jgi:DNA-binding GntR family transcriptional regulator
MQYVKKKNESKQEIAYKFIKDAIIRNEFKPNTMLVENNLCNMLGFSKTPIREALRRLTSEGLVEFLPKKGSFVSVITFRDFIDIFEVREALEGMAARLCTQRHNPDEMQQLKEQLLIFEKCLKSGDSENVFNADMKQHEIIMKSSRNAQLNMHYDTLYQQIKRIRLITKEDYERQSLSFDEHKALIEAILNKDAEAAEIACRKHIQSIKNYIINKNYLKDR